MKNRWILAFSALFSVFLLSIAAAAAETYQSMAELYQHWSTTQMPDWVCSVVSADGSSERLAVVVNSNAAAGELTAMVEDASSMEIIVADGSYGYHELLRVQEAIAGEYMGTNGKGGVMRIATGLALVDGKVVGFGESGKELRVIVGVQPQYADAFRSRFQKQYGDMVYVEVAEDAVLMDAALEPPLIFRYRGYVMGILALLAGAVAIFLFIRRRNSAAAK